MIHGQHEIEAILFPKHDLNRAKSMRCEYQTGYTVNIHLSKPQSENRSLYLCSTFLNSCYTHVTHIRTSLNTRELAISTINKT